jgi:hypothetical protein
MLPLSPPADAASVPGLAPAPDVAPLLCNDPDGFAWGVMHDRHPALIEQTRNAHPYGPEQHAALDALLTEATIGNLKPLSAGAADRAAWDAWGTDYFGKPWADAPFLWAESYFYRRLLDAVGFFTPGPWFWVDPFDHLKSAELQDPALEQELVTLDKLLDLTPRQRTEALLLASLWGNRADLGFRIGLEAAANSHHELAGLVADDTHGILEHLDQTTKRIHVIADNAGRELLSDLVLIDDLLTNHSDAAISLQVKPSPYYVSDAVTADVAACLRRLAATAGTAADISRRVREAIRRGRLSITTHWFYTAPLSFHHMPADLARDLATSALVIVKGDLNYRRVVGDCAWDPTTPFADTVAYLPAPVAVLRTLKSDVIVGVDTSTVLDLDVADSHWRTNGTRGLLQLGVARKD